MICFRLSIPNTNFSIIPRDQPTQLILLYLMVSTECKISNPSSRFTLVFHINKSNLICARLDKDLYDTSTTLLYVNAIEKNTHINISLAQIIIVRDLEYSQSIVRKSFLIYP